MIRIGLLIFVFAGAVVGVWFFTTTNPSSAENVKLFSDEASSFQEKRYADASGEQMPYLLFAPGNLNPQTRYPLVLWLHGGGSRGEKLSQILAYGDKHGPLFFARPDTQKTYPCFIVAPLCPADRFWATPDSVDPSPQTRLVFAILDDVMARYPIDSQRLYVTGISMGGYGAWEMIARRPAMFAAAVPICGGGNPAKAEQMKSVPIWAFHGDRDELVPVSESRKMVEALKRAGGKVKYTEYQGVGHSAWDQAFAEAELLPWLFTQKKV